MKTDTTPKKKKKKKKEGKLQKTRGRLDAKQCVKARVLTGTPGQESLPSTPKHGHVLHTLIPVSSAHRTETKT